MANPDMPRQNSRSFDPDKGLPLIAERSLGFKKRGEGAAKKAEENYQMYSNGRPVELEVEEKLPRKHYVPKRSK